MSSEIIHGSKYKNWLESIKVKIRSARTRAVFSLNKELIKLYWEIGHELFDKVDKANWGTGIIDQIAKDLKREFPDIKGTSRSNLFYMKQFFSFYNDNNLHADTIHLLDEYLNRDFNDTKVQQVVGLLTDGDNESSITEKIQHVVGLIPWSHNIVIISKEKDINKAIWYVIKSAENVWSREILLNQIESKLYKRQKTGNKITNFIHTLPSKLAEAAENTLKDPYIFDFIKLHENAIERDFENQLVNHISKFLIELGKGFAYVGRQYHIEVSNKDFYIDLLFYHLKLHSYVVIELKTGEFKPDFAGQLNFYLSVVDDLIKDEHDNPSIGILICKSKDEIVAKYALHGMNKPMGVTEYKLTKAIPKKLQPSLPTIEEIERDLEKIQ
jgi:predicted nuclease of restriction endonuclease-like (RecB) superfamily